ncbi:MAG: ABC transporter ATP-binding protein [Candidatus Omnitrophota bacterium]|jgi:lipoprotein-releasing system ATP-binding protein|nr:MAG: ABC transporter ATP-binding protein [Candidatus Omnitrophota bacterium]
MLCAKDIRKNYKTSAGCLQVLKKIDLEVKPNEFVAIQGPSGAGKSTLLHILGGLDMPSCGSVHFEGKDVYGLSENERAIFRNRNVGFVFQFYHLLSELSVLENVLLPSLIQSWWERKRARIRAVSLLEKLQLTERTHYKAGVLSGGEMQRVAIARALINEPRLLLCDEPTGNLDSENGNRILQLLRQLRQDNNVTLVLVTHDQNICMSADRVVHIKDGVLLN